MEKARELLAEWGIINPAMTCIAEYINGILIPELVAVITQEHKSGKRMWKYIEKKACEALNNRSGALPGEQVIVLAMDYLMLDDAEEVQQEQERAATAKAEAAKRQAELAARLEASKKAQEKKEADKQTEARVKDSQLSLFDLGGALGA